MSVSVAFSLYDKSVKLPSIYQKRAKKELNEEPSQVSAHLESFRRWITSMPHLKCPMDDEFLLAFLRHAKFNHAKAQTRLDNFCTFRTSETEGYPSWFPKGAERAEMWKKYLDLGCFVPLGILSNGTAVMYMKFSKLSLEKITYEEAMNAFEIWNDYTLMDSRMQISGSIYITDASELTKKILMEMWRPKDSKFSTKYFQECLPFRVGQLIYCNVSPLFDALFKMASVWLNEKMKSRIMVLKADIQPAFDKIPGLKELVPEECGGSNKSFEKLIALSRKMLDGVPKHTPIFDISVDESKRPQSAKNLMKEYKDIPDNLMGTSGTFVKLNDDEI